MRAIDNIAYPLRLMRLGAPEIARRIDRLAAAFDLAFDLHAYPYQLSGGQQQTVSIMRALVIEPEVLLLDEPFSALDYEMTLIMRDQLEAALRTTRTTSLLVSHDLEEAIYLADRLLLLTRRPTRVAAFLEVPIERPRTAAATTTPAFTALRAEALAIFQSAVRATPRP
jgi:NitT/TauT family transport system ATP-binding protein